VRPGIRSLLVGGIVLLAGLAVATAPSIDRVVGPFELVGGLGDTVDARLYSATVSRVELARELDLAYGQDGFSYTAPSVASEQVFVVVDVRLESAVDKVLVQYSELVIGGVTYRVAPFLPGPNILNPPAGPGIPVEGTLVFEVPTSVIDSGAAAYARLHIKSELTPQLESVPVFTLDLDGLDVERVRVVEPATIPADIR